MGTSASIIIPTMEFRVLISNYLIDYSREDCSVLF